MTHRQHPETANGAVFLNLEDETGHVNVIFSKGAWARWRHLARERPALLIPAASSERRGWSTSSLSASSPSSSARPCPARATSAEASVALRFGCAGQEARAGR